MMVLRSRRLPMDESGSIFSTDFLCAESNPCTATAGKKVLTGSR
jgi:hypothetical protein